MKRFIFLASIAMSLAAAISLVHAFNNDGQTDILWRNYASTNNNIWLMNGTSYMSQANLPPVPVDDANNQWRMIATGDFNRDHQLDIVWFDLVSRQTAIWYMNGSTHIDTAFVQWQSGGVATPGSSEWDLVGVGYVGGYTDNTPDLIWRNHVTGQNAVWYLDNFTVVTTGSITSTDAGYRLKGVGDFNRDGHPDFLWQHSTTKDNALWYLNGVNIVSTAWLPHAGDTGWDIAGADHFDADGKIDLLWRHASTGQNAVWFMDNSTLLSGVLIQGDSNLNRKIGGTGDSRLDTDRDGLPDLWERNHFGNLDQNAHGDWDADGVSNLQEFLNGASPVDTLGLQVFTPLK